MSLEVQRQILVMSLEVYIDIGVFSCLGTPDLYMTNDGYPTIILAFVSSRSGFVKSWSAQNSEPVPVT
jgi:hypothetical protein